MPPHAPLKIIRVITRLNIGGPAQQAIALSERMAGYGWSTLLISGPPGDGEGDMSYLMEGKNLRYLSLPELGRELRPLRDLRAVWKILRCLLREEPLVLHTHTAKAGAVGRLAAVLYRLGTGKRLWVFHTFHGHALEGYFGRWKTRLFCAAERLLRRATTCLITVSESLRQELAAMGVALVSKIRVIPLGLPLDRPLALGPPGPPSPWKVGLVGRMVPIKNHPMFFEAVRILAGRGKTDGMKFLLYGDGELRSSLQALAEKMGILPLLEFRGWERDICAIYRQLHAVCLTSRNEGTPVSLIEAMAAGRPVVSTRVGGVPDLVGGVRQEANGFQICERGILVPRDDALALAAALEHLAENPETARRLGEAGRKFAAERFALERLAREMDHLYREFLPCGPFENS